MNHTKGHYLTRGGDRRDERMGGETAGVGNVEREREATGVRGIRRGKAVGVGKVGVTRAGRKQTCETSRLEGSGSGRQQESAGTRGSRSRREQEREATRGGRQQERKAAGAGGSGSGRL